MGTIDILVYIFIFVIIPINIYLKKSGKTFVEMVKDIVEAIKNIFGTE